MRVNSRIHSLPEVHNTTLMPDSLTHIRLQAVKEYVKAIPLYWRKLARDSNQGHALQISGPLFAFPERQTAGSFYQVLFSKYQPEYLKGGILCVGAYLKARADA